MSERRLVRDARGRGCFALFVIASCGGDSKPATEQAPGSTPPPSAAATLNINAPKCGYEPNASIFDKPAEMWTAQLEQTPDAYLNLSVWKPKSGEPIQFNLAVQSGGPDLREISTVVGGTLKGAGTATISPQGAGGAISIDGTDASGSALKLSVTCARFDPIAEEGGR